MASRPLAVTVVPLLALAGVVAGATAVTSTPEARARSELFRRAEDWLAALARVDLQGALQFVEPARRADPGVHVALRRDAITARAGARVARVRVRDGRGEVSLGGVQRSVRVRWEGVEEVEVPDLRVWLRDATGTWYLHPP